MMLVIVNDCNENHSERLKISNESFIERKSVKFLFQFNKLSGCDAIYEDKALCSARYYLYLIVLFVTFALFVFFSSHKIKQILSNGTNVFVVCIKNIKYFFNRGSHFHQVWLHLVIILKVWSIADQ